MTLWMRGNSTTASGCPEYAEDSSHVPSPSPLLPAAVVLAGIAFLLSGGLILEHLRHYRLPRLQKHIARILLMVPVYALASLLALQDYRRAVYWNVARDAYEGFVIISFFALITQYLGPTLKIQQRVLAAKGPHAFPPPACLWRNDPTHRHFLSWSRLGVMQYVVVRVSTSVAAAVLEYNQLYCPESMNLLYGHFYTTLLNGASMGVAMFTLITFYIAIHSNIYQYKPVLQFLSVKFVIFFGFWQGFLIKVLLSSPSGSMSRWIGGGEGDKRSMAQKSMDLQSLLTAAEMALASIIHIKAFDYRILLRVVKEEEDKERSLVRAGKKRMSLPKDEAQQDDGKPPILNGTDLTASPVDQSNMDVVEPLDILDFAQESRQFEDWTNPDIEEEQPRDEQVSSPSTLPVRQLPFGQAFADAFVPSDIVTDLYSVSKFVLSRLSKLWKGTLKAWSSGKVLPRWDSVPSEGYATLSEDGSTAQERPDAERKSGRNNGLVHSNSINSTRGLLRSGSETGYTTSWPPPQRQDSFYSDPFSSQPGQLDEDGFGSGWEWSLSPRLGADKGESGDGGYTDAQELVNLGPSSSPKE